MKSSQNPNGAAGGDPSIESESDEPQAPDSPYLERFGINAGWVEEIQDQYRIDTRSVDESWSAEFGGVVEPRAIRDQIRRASSRPPSAPSNVLEKPVRPRQATLDSSEPPPSARSGSNGFLTGGVPIADSAVLHIADRHARVLRLIHAFRARGHRVAQSDPLGGQSTYFPELDPAHYGFGNENLDEPYVAGDLPGGSVQTLRQILTRLGKTYCGPIGVEFTHVQDPGHKAWLRALMEESQTHPNLADGERRKIPEKLASAASASSMSARVWSAEIWKRISSSPCGTTGYARPVASTPCPRRC